MKLQASNQGLQALIPALTLSAATDFEYFQRIVTMVEAPVGDERKGIIIGGAWAPVRYHGGGVLRC